MIEIGIGLAVVVALLTNLASLLKHRGCAETRPVSLARPLASARGLVGSPLFVAGWGLAALAWLLHLAALSFAPISLVQAVLAGGAVTLAVMCQRLFGGRVDRRQWLALLLGGSGLALLVVTIPSFDGSHSTFSFAAMASFEGGLVLLAIGLALGHRSERLPRHRPVLLSVLAGVLFALAGVAVKGLMGGAHHSPAFICSLLALTILCGVLAQYTAVAALQSGEAIETIGLMGLVANAVQIVAGVLVFSDPLSPSPLGLVLQGGAFAMVCASALLMPAIGPRPRLARA